MLITAVGSGEICLADGRYCIQFDKESNWATFPWELLQVFFCKNLDRGIQNFSFKMCLRSDTALSTSGAIRLCRVMENSLWLLLILVKPLPFQWEGWVSLFLHADAGWSRPLAGVISPIGYKAPSAREKWEMSLSLCEDNSVDIQIGFMQLNSHRCNPFLFLIVFHKLPVDFFF